MIDIDNRINDNEELDCWFPNRCVFDVERNAIGVLRVLSKNKNGELFEKKKENRNYIYQLL
jgi:hypothetical protein